MWSSLLTVLVIAVASNLDNAGVGIAYGVRKIRISWVANALIAVISGAATYLSGELGRVVTGYVSVRWASWIGALVMIFVGIWVATEPLRQKPPAGDRPGNVVTRILRDPVEADFDNSQSISMTEALILGLALAMNALAGGFDAGIVRIGIDITALFVALFSFVLLGASAYVGSRFAARTLGSKATYIAGVLLILIGVHQIW